MMTPLWWSQPFPPTGAITSEGIRNQLGRPPVDPLTVMVRETGQNSWDARLPEVDTVSYRLELTTVAPTHRPNWERLLAPPRPIQSHLRLADTVRRPDLRLLTVADRGTKGLGGPIRADQVTDGARDWVSFVLNVGEKRDVAMGGGTYGYGKAALYRLSRVGTILVYTRTATSGTKLSSRLIGIALGESFEDVRTNDARPYTGRHWWGDVHDDHVEPVVDDEADDVARMLGIRPFRPEETGTTIVVIDPDLDGFEDVSETGEHLADTIAWHMWPLMLPERLEHRLVPEVIADGRVIPVPDPACAYPLRLFVAAYRELSTDRATTLRCLRPRRDLGRFALERTIVLPMMPGEASRAADFAGVDGDPHHVCLMRSPELVVRYLEGPRPGSVHQAYAGVFRGDDDLDDVYAAAEPPTHDNWVYDQLTGPAKTFVKTTFTRVREELAGLRAPVATTATSFGGPPLGAASNYLGGLVAAAFADPDDDRNVGFSEETSETSMGHTDAPSHPVFAPPGVPTHEPTGGTPPIDRHYEPPESHVPPEVPYRPAPSQPDDRAAASLVGPVDDIDLVLSGQLMQVPEEPIRVRPVADPGVEEMDDRVVVVQRFAVRGTGTAVLEARLSVATWEGREQDAPAGADRPRVHLWRTPDGEPISEQCVVRAPAEVDLVVVPVPDTVTDIAVIGSRPVKTT